MSDSTTDTSLDEFRAEVLAFLDANAERKVDDERQEVRVGRGRRRRRPVRGGRPRAGAARPRRRQGVAGQALRRRPRLDHRAEASTAAAS